MLHLIKQSAAHRSKLLQATEYTPLSTQCFHTSLIYRWFSTTIDPTTPPSWDDAVRPAWLAAKNTDNNKKHNSNHTKSSLPPKDKHHIENLIKAFQRSAVAKNDARELYVNAKLFNKAAKEFGSVLLLASHHHHPSPSSSPPPPPSHLHTFLLNTPPRQEMSLFPLFAQYVLDQHAEELRAYRNLVHASDLRTPHEWFPVARALKRRIIYHSGPTNSGKTHQALEAMMKADSGVYCGPLRLLAMEVYERLNTAGTYCNLVTGQERRMVPGAEHTACTVEMIGLNNRVDVAVIDEIQLMGDGSRGWAWTRAVLGVAANEIHVCGDGSAVALLKRLCEDVGDEMEVREYERFTPLEVEEREGNGGGKEALSVTTTTTTTGKEKEADFYKYIRPGDCIVAFSRKEIYKIKAQVEAATAHKACVVYGALPPETRRAQAKLFNEEDNEYRVLVASDAVGMGLNLNIGRIIFKSLTKFEKGDLGEWVKVPVSVSLIKQIAGRAGRRSSAFAELGGTVTCVSPHDIPRLKQAIAVPLNQLATPRAGLFPEFEHLELFAAKQPPNTSFGDILRAFASSALVNNNHYFLCKQESVYAASDLLSGMNLSLKDAYNFCTSPTNTKDLKIASALLHFATKYASGTSCPLLIDVPTNSKPRNLEEVQHLEAAHQVTMLWMWLSYRFDEEAFPGRLNVEVLGETMCSMLNDGLAEITSLSKKGMKFDGGGARAEYLNLLKGFKQELTVLEQQEKQQQQQQEQQHEQQEKQQQLQPTSKFKKGKGTAAAAPEAAAIS